MYTVYLKTPPYILITRQKINRFLTIFGVQNLEEISHQKNYKFAHLAWIKLPHYLVKNNLSDAACLIVDHTQHINWLFSVPPTYNWGRLL